MDRAGARRAPANIQFAAILDKVTVPATCDEPVFCNCNFAKPAAELAHVTKAGSGSQAREIGYRMTVLAVLSPTFGGSDRSHG
jgi:hypothetical protein